jgi:hypothetical protein
MNREGSAARVAGARQQDVPRRDVTGEVQPAIEEASASELFVLGGASGEEERLEPDARRLPFLERVGRRHAILGDDAIDLAGGSPSGILQMSWPFMRTRSNGESFEAADVDDMAGL